MKDDEILTFAGILEPLVNVLEHSTRQQGRLVGQEIVMHHRKDIQAIIAIGEKSDVHLLITPASNNDLRLNKISLKGLRINDMEWSVSGHPVNRYLDVSCSGALPGFKRPFLRFAEDVLFEMLHSVTPPADAVYKTCLRWQKFWSPESTKEITREWINGLFGELLFLRDLIKKYGSGTVDYWTGPLGRDHDFQKTEDIAVEIKTSVEIPFRITCNLNQLDSELFKKLYIACYRLTPSDNGVTLPDLAREIERLLKNNDSQLNLFYERLASAGYEFQHESIYREYKIDHEPVVMFLVDSNFPKIVEKSFIKAPDHRITNIKYTLQLTGLDGVTIEATLSDLSKFKDA